MSNQRDQPDAHDPGATLSDDHHENTVHGPPADETVMATGEFMPDTPPSVIPAPPSQSPPQETLADSTGMFLPDGLAPSDSSGRAPTIAAPTLEPRAQSPVRNTVVVPAADHAGSDRPGLAATQAIEGTGVFLPGGEPPPPFSPEATLDITSGGGATVDLAATAAFGPDGTEPASASAARDRPGLPVTDIMATGDFCEPAAGPSVRSRNVPLTSRCGRYVLKHFHAKGGMGEIWMAEDPDIGRPVALKRMLSERPDQVYRFRVEAQVTGQLEHPGIVPVHELGVNEMGQTFYAMKFVQGRTLKKVVEEYHEQKATGRASEVEEVRLLQIFLSLCQTVAYAHSRGVLHRDLKPENVMLGEFGETILLDWGIAKVVGQPEEAPGQGAATFVHLEYGGEGTETRAGAIMGTPSYMAPEVAAGLNDEVDFRSDVYLLGATLYEMLTARQPRTGKTAFEMIRKAKAEPPARVRTVDPLIPKALDAISYKAMAHAKQDRYQSARELADDVQRYLAGEPVTAYREDFWERAWRWARRHRIALGRAAAAIVIVGASTFGYAEFRKLQRESARLAREVAINKERDQARRDLNEFRRLADEASFYAATTDQIAENAPYSDPRRGEETTKAALELASKWGPALEGLPLEDERTNTARKLYELNRLASHLKDRAATPVKSDSTKIARLDEGARSQERPRHAQRPTRLISYQTPEAAKGPREESKPTEESKQSLTALDHFFRGETYRDQSAKHKDIQPVRDAWKPDPELMEKAIGEYRKALTLDPEHYWSHFQIGRCYLSIGQLLESVEALGTCIALRPESPWGYSVRGLALLQLKRFAEAERDLDEAVRLNPEFRPSRLNRGTAYWAQKKFDEAMADFAAVLEPPHEKRLIEGAYYLGIIYSQLGDNRKALKEFNAVVAENPHMRPAYYYRAVVHFADGDEALGLEDLDNYIANGGQIERDGWKIHGAHGHLLRAIHSKELPAAQRREKWGLALANLAVGELLQAISLGGRAWDIFDDLGAMLEHTGRLKEAIPAYSKGLEFEPKNVKLRNKRAWAWENLGRHNNALADFVAAAAADPENAEAHTGIGYVRALSKQTSEAQREADLALLHGSDDFLVLHNVACIYATLSEGNGTQPEAYQDVAIAVLKRAIAKWKKAETPLNEFELIKAEPAFKSLRERRDFKELVATEPSSKAG